MASIFNQLLSWVRAKICPACACTTPAQAPPVPPTSFFDSALAYVFPNEGGYSADPSDHGGPTSMGITLATLREWRNRSGHKLVMVMAEDVKQMPRSEACDIYRQWYWVDPGFDQIKTKPIAIALFDQGVLCGTATATALAQQAANNCGANLTVDGHVGPFTVAAIEYVDIPRFLRSFRDLLNERSALIVKNDASQAVFYNGWVARANRLVTLVGFNN